MVLCPSAAPAPGAGILTVLQQVHQIVATVAGTCHFEDVGTSAAAAAETEQKTEAIGAKIVAVAVLEVLRNWPY